MMALLSVSSVIQNYADVTSSFSVFPSCISGVQHLGAIFAYVTVF